MLLVQFGYNSETLKKMPVYKRRYISERIREINKPKDTKKLTNQ